MKERGVVFVDAVDIVDWMDIPVTVTLERLVQ